MHSRHWLPTHCMELNSTDWTDWTKLTEECKSTALFSVHWLPVYSTPKSLRKWLNSTTLNSTDWSKLTVPLDFSWAALKWLLVKVWCILPLSNLSLNYHFISPSIRYHIFRLNVCTQGLPIYQPDHTDLEVLWIWSEQPSGWIKIPLHGHLKKCSLVFFSTSY